jgi:hypothetical protein
MNDQFTDENGDFDEVEFKAYMADIWEDYYNDFLQSQSEQRKYVLENADAF